MYRIIKILILSALFLVPQAYAQYSSQGVYFTMVLNYVPDPSTCYDFSSSGALYLEVDKDLPDSSLMNGTRGTAIITPNYTVALYNINPGVSTLLPALNEQIYCNARCALNNPNCLNACHMVVDHFNKSQIPVYADNQKAIFVRCPTFQISNHLRR